MKNLKRLTLLRIVVCAGWLAGICFSFELWFPLNRTFPRAPALFELPENAVVPVERLLSLILVISLVSIIFFPRRKIFSISAIVSLILLIFFDQTRLQPWVYQYLLVLIVAAVPDWTEDETAARQALGLAQILLAALYFWSGAQKLNFSFAHEILPMLLSPLESLLPSLRAPLVLPALAVALTESLIGVGLLCRRTRNLSVWLAAAMHAIILGLLIAKNYNSVVWVWNAALILLVFISFWRSDASFKQTIQTARGGERKLIKSIVAASVLLPVLSFAGWWDMYLSGALYSGNTEVAVIEINEDFFEKLPPRARATVFRTKAGEAQILPLLEWSINELNVPAYPERRVSEEAARQACRLTSDKNQIELIIKQRPAILDGSYKVTRIGCAELENY